MKIVYELATHLTNASDFRKVYTLYADEFMRKYGVELDHTSDPSRACFLSYDPEIYINENATPLVVNLPLNGESSATKATGKRKRIVQALAGTHGGNRTHTVTSLASILRDHGIDEEFTLNLVKAWNQQNADPVKPGKLEYTVHEMFDRYGDKGALANYWSYGMDILDIGIIDSKFYMEKNSINKVYVRAGAYTDEDRSKSYSHLVTAKHIPHLARINFLGDVSSKDSFYQYKPDNAVIDVHYAPIPVKMQDNQFIEDYLERLFGQYKTFIKEWLAVYCYTNYQKLPFLILTGDRGTGKNTFAETVAEIFPTISTMWHGEEKNFNPEVEMKLLIADETVSDDPHQYKVLKKHSGQKEIVVNHKYLKPYKVQNNINVMILSNAKTPISVERDENPTCEENNQFFVYRLKKFTGKIDGTYGNKLVDRLGHYIRTELKQVFDALQLEGNRYSIKVPITDEERALFINNISNVDLVVDQYIERIVKEYGNTEDPRFAKFVDAKYLISSFFDNYTIERYRVTRADVIKRFVERGLLGSAEIDRKQLPKTKERQYVYSITGEFLERIQQEADTACDKKAQEKDPKQLSLPIVATPCP